MRQVISGFVLSCVFTIVADTALAQEGKQPPRNREKSRQREGQRRGGGGNLLFRTLDVDGDGKLSPKEIENALVSLRKLDKNKDGQLTREELRPEGAEGNRRGERQRRGEGQRRDKQRESGDLTEKQKPSPTPSKD